MNNCKKGFGFIHKTGILMAVSSLPSPFGIGTLGKGAFDFIDLLDECGQTCWQVLPLNPTSYGDSPYQSPAAIAGNPYFIDPELLGKQGLLTDGELQSFRVGEGRVDYGRLFEMRYPMLRLAYSRFSPDKDFKNFCKKNSDWLDDYALFMALKVKNGYRSWTLWPQDQREYRVAFNHRIEHEAECGFWRWVQYEFMRQWRVLSDYAHSRGISIIGDMPIYVAHDSMDVWRAPDQFLLDESYNPTVVAGCPPDAYTPDGQLWGNPIYDWNKMKSDGFRWWIDRVGKALSLYDLVRIDHFRGFAGYFSIEYGEPTARNGKWNAAPGKELFSAIRNAYPKGRIIAEDLGVITDDVRELLSFTDFPGMKVLQFAFYDENNEYLPRCYKTDNCIAYVSSHDSDCARSWYNSLRGDALRRFKRECPRRDGQSATNAVIELAMRSRANLVIITMQDYLELTNAEGRMNIPSVAEGNWTWRIGPRYRTRRLRDSIKDMTERTGRGK